MVSQTRAAFAGVPENELAKVVVAYEPIWAIGSGKNCDPHEANRVMGTIRASIGGLSEAPMLYGGSMNAQNVAQYRAQPEIDGGLIGGASLDPEGFATLIARSE